MLELIQSVHLFAGIVLLAVLMTLLIFSSRALRWPEAPGRAQHYAPLEKLP